MRVLFIAPKSMAHLAAAKGEGCFIIPRNAIEWYRYTSKFKLLDNGAYEGDIVDFDKLMELAKDMMVDEIVIPDVMRDYKKTKENAKEYLDKVPVGYQRALVPQGKDVNEFLKCFKEFQELGAETLCFPKWLGKDRPFVVNYLYDRGELPPTTQYHLLGLDDLSELYGYPYFLRGLLRSFDTSKPFTYAFHGKLMETFETERLTRVPFDTPAFEGAQRKLLLENIRRVMNAVGR